MTAIRPEDEYSSRRNSWLARKQQDDRLYRRIGNWRLLVAVIAAVLAYGAFGPNVLSSWWLAVPAAVFIALAIWHNRVTRRQTVAVRALAYYDAALARVEDRWAGKGQTGDAYRDSNHIYADDLDVFGKGSLFELIANTRTAAGERTLANWLLAPATVAEAKLRQSAVEELRTRLDLREDLALLGPDIQSEVHVDALTKWASQPAVSFPPLLRPAAVLLAFFGICVLVGFFAQAVPLAALALILGVNIGLTFALRSRTARVFSSAETIAHGLDVLALALARFEKESFTSPMLQALQARLQTDGPPASSRIARLCRWIEWMESSDHILMRATNPLVLWREQIAMGIESWRRSSAPRMAGWLETIAELEALSSLGALAFEHPDWQFPELLSPSEGRARALVKATDLHHPLLPRKDSVPNDIHFEQPLQLWIVSGSNMSGKSTLLRSVGLNAVLAWAGAPVAASRMLISPVQTTASLRITDSLLDHRSRFFAEITRLRRIVDLAQQETPVLFLLDEILSGTNSHDRRIGAAAVIRKLVSTGAIGLVTTHDLALAEIQQELGNAACNAHFEDRIVDGHMHFDYRLKPGVVTHSNALALMRAVGLEV